MASKVTDYERKRLENIKRNEVMMGFVKLHKKSNQFSSASKPQRIEKGYKTNAEKKPKTKPPIVIRHSLRSCGIPPDASTTSGLEDDLAASPKKIKNPSSHLDYSIQELGPLRMQQAYTGSVSIERQFIDTIMGMLENVPFSRSKKRVNAGCFDLELLKLKLENVAWVVPRRIFSVGFFPFEKPAMFVAGDRVGNVGFWDVDCEEGSGDGVYL